MSTRTLQSRLACEQAARGFHGDGPVHAVLVYASLSMTFPIVYGSIVYGEPMTDSRV
jgi:hypothetical protein